MPEIELRIARFIFNHDKDDRDTDSEPAFTTDTDNLATETDTDNLATMSAGIDTQNVTEPADIDIQRVVYDARTGLPLPVDAVSEYNFPVRDIRLSQQSQTGGGAAPQG